MNLWAKPILSLTFAMIGICYVLIPNHDQNIWMVGAIWGSPIFLFAFIATVLTLYPERESNLRRWEKCLCPSLCFALLTG